MKDQTLIFKQSVMECNILYAQEKSYTLLRDVAVLIVRKINGINC